ncbi:unnamed protein product [Polarella glacialis]|uniref:Sec23/Sec24 trunk domain-containing protein n=1 Tax=Polarella glacialis TaxID=89957 RepID=A0A813JQP6_POLGL|nr:unnamed protein product [Polarella glacialis]
MCFREVETGRLRRWTESTHQAALPSASEGKGSSCMPVLRMLEVSGCVDCDPEEVSVTSSVQCEFCGAAGAEAWHTRGISPVQEMAEGCGATYLLSTPATDELPDDSTSGLAPSMVIFCIDVSASMHTSLKVTGNGSVTRLQCVQSAVSSQLEALRKEQPDCVVVIVTFGGEVCVYTAGGNSSLVAQRAHASEADLVAKGKELGGSCTEKVADVLERLQATVGGLKPCGNTALGPALAVAVGLASCRTGSKIVLCTDGMANNGVGAIGDRNSVVPFYGDIGLRAAEEGTCISIVTMEGEDCSMENLGICADLTGGQVEMVDLQHLTLNSKVGAMLANPTLATSLKITLIVGSHCSVRDADSDETRRRGSACISVRKLGSVTARSDLTFELDTSTVLQAGAGASSLPVQLQLHYTLPSGEELLQVLTAQPLCSSSREEAEADINGTAVALWGLHKAARLAQQGTYRSARSELISTCRLLQRAMRDQAHQEAYLAFVVQAEKLDGFMRERELQEQVLGSSSTAGQNGRDDDASRSMYDNNNRK